MGIPKNNTAATDLLFKIVFKKVELSTLLCFLLVNYFLKQQLQKE